MHQPSDKQLQDLAAAARQACRQSYAPYSRFPVGAAVLTAGGDIVTGCNVENASLGLTCCAERVAIFTAVARGERHIVALAVYTPTAKPTPPCGSCRQVLQEFGGTDTIVTSLCDGNEVLQTSLAALLPSPFSPDQPKE